MRRSFSLDSVSSRRRRSGIPPSGVRSTILRPATATAFLLVFIESVKELSATIMLRPFGVSTLSTYIYDFASRARVEEVGLAALMVMAAGIIPVIILTRTMLNR